MVFTNYEKFGAPGQPLKFLTHRIERIVPLYWICTLATLVILLFPHGVISKRSILGSLLFIPVTDAGGTILPLLPTGWTLNFEMLFYAVFALCLTLPRKAGLWLATAILTALMLLGIAIRPSMPALIYWTHPLFIEFMLGMLLGVARKRGVRVSVPTGLAISLLGVVVLAGFAVSGYSVPDRLVDKWLPIFWGVPCALLVAGAALSDDGRPAPIWLRPVTFLGDASYSIYLAHLMIFFLGHWLMPFLMNEGALGLAVEGLAAGIALHLAVERPIVWFFKQRRAAAAVGARVTVAS